MDLVLDSDLMAVAEFMQRNVPAARLVGVASAVAALAPALWGHYESEDVAALRLREPSLTASPHDRRIQSDASGSHLAARSYLLTQKFIPQAADTAIRSYRETKALVDAESAGYAAPVSPPTGTEASAVERTRTGLGELKVEASGTVFVTRRALLPLPEGTAAIELPEPLTEDSLLDLRDWVETMLRRAERVSKREKIALPGTQRDPSEGEV